MALESEVKFSVTDLAEFEKKLKLLNAHILNKRTFEDNWIYDSPAGLLRTRAVLLRMRVYGNSSLLTVKENPRTKDGMKLRDEYEVEVSDPGQMKQILTSLGFKPSLRYQKFRTVYSIRGLHIFLDETPIGVYAEIEGERQEVYQLAEELGLDKRTAITSSYIDLYRLTGGKGDMIFS